MENATCPRLEGWPTTTPRSAHARLTMAMNRAPLVLAYLALVDVRYSSSLQFMRHQMNRAHGRERGLQTVADKEGGDR